MSTVCLFLHHAIYDITMILHDICSSIRASWLRSPVSVTSPHHTAEFLFCPDLWHWSTKLLVKHTSKFGEISPTKNASTFKKRFHFCYSPKFLVVIHIRREVTGAICVYLCGSGFINVDDSLTTFFVRKDTVLKVLILISECIYLSLPFLMIWC